MRTLLALLVLVPALASAQPVEASEASLADDASAEPLDADAQPPPSWSIGAGLSSSDYVFFGSSVSTYGGLLASGAYPLVASATIPVVNASLERAIGGRTWLVIGIAGAAQREDYESTEPPSSSSGTVRHVEAQSGAVELGVRGVATPSDAFVTVSWLGTVEAGIAHTKAEVLYPGQATVYEPRWEARYLAATFGLAVERALGERLAIRLATPLARVMWGDTEQRAWNPVSAAITKGSTAGVSVVIAPRLELRVFF